LPHETLGKFYLGELEAEAAATRKCLERIDMEKLRDWKPHDKSMKMGDLAMICAEIPKWITQMIEKDHIDFATFDHAEIKTTEDLVTQFDKNMDAVRKSLNLVQDQEFGKPFSLKNQGQVLFTSPKKENISSSINHLVHHRGQLTVYMRLNDISVPSIYGPSADDKTF
jgi:uncharacterized damage-inducible protein DinB